MPPFADQLARLRVAAATGKLPADLGRWALAELAARADADDRRELRDRLLVEAGRALLPDGSTWARAETLAAHVAHRSRAHELVAAALEVDPETPRSARQLFSILKSAAFRFQTSPTEGEKR